jgi:hypothetical protein
MKYTKFIFKSSGGITVEVCVIFVKNIPGMKVCANHAMRTAISNLPMAFKIPHNVQRKVIMPNYGIEFFPHITHDNG